MARRVTAIASEHTNPIVYAEAVADVPGLQSCCGRAGLVWCGTLAASSLFKYHGASQATFKDTQVWYAP